MKTVYTEVAPMALTTHHVRCPFCAKAAGTIDHLAGQDVETAWYCNHCGCRYGVHLRHGKLFVAKLEGRKDKTLVLLHAGHIGLVVEGLRLTGAGVETGDAQDAHYYNSHTCPANYMPHVKAVIDLRNKDVDPHGIFPYQLTLPYDERIEDCNDRAFLETLIPQFEQSTLTE